MNNYRIKEDFDEIKEGIKVVDIVVTIPQSEYENDDVETRFLYLNPYYYQFWTLSKVPKKLKVGDRVYFVKRNKIESSMKVFDIKSDQVEHCDVTDRYWSGKCLLYLNDLRYENINIQTKGFQGFRYKWW